MSTFRSLAFLAAAALVIPVASAQQGPFPPTDWPTTIDPAKTVHYVVTDEGLAPPSDTWSPVLTILSGGDQVTEDISIGGFTARKVTANYLNIADSLYETWAAEPVIDILVQAYGDAALFNANGEPRNFNFLTGVLPELAFPVGGQVPVEARNNKWNWILFRIPNGTRGDGTPLVGWIPDNAQGNSSAGGVNGGTIRFEGVPNLIVRAVAFGQEGAFGTPEDFTAFEPPEACDPEPETNLVGIDVSANMADHVEILDDGDQTVTYEDNVGPADDKRRAVRPDSLYLNFGVTEEYLGKPCNEPRTVKICVEFYDDPNFAGVGVTFGPEAYATDAESGLGFVPATRRHTLEGTDRWIRRSWVVPAVNLRGVNAGSLTAGPRFISENGLVAVSSFQMALFRTGDHPLAGQDPLADCYQDQLICTDAYGNFAELDLAQDLRDGLDVGSSGGDQNMVVEEAGPASDRRMAVRAAHDDGAPGFAHQYLNFAITEEALGPSTQDPALLAVCATYYDDPQLAGATFRPEVYQTERGGDLALAFLPTDVAVTLEGTDAWRQAYWEIPAVKFNGVNQGPQAAARFTSSGKIFISRLRYAVIRPCGPNAGVNLLEDCKPPPAQDPLIAFAREADGSIRLSWPAGSEGFALESTGALGTAWTAVAEIPVMEGNDLVVTVRPTGTTFYRLISP
jgi:hypothetical protein